MVTLHFSVKFEKPISKNRYPEKVGLGKYDGDMGVEGELSGYKFRGYLASYKIGRRWYFDEVGFFVECEKISDAIETARAIEKALSNKGLKFSVPHYELTLDILVILPFRVFIRNGSCQYEIMSGGIDIQCEKLEDFNSIKK